MKSILLKTLAAASLVATSHAAIHVMGASFKERGVNAPSGDIIPNPGTVVATRGYLILDSTMLTTTPGLATYIEYGEIRGGGVVDRFFTVDTDFDAFRADVITGDSGGLRLYGHMHAPVLVAPVTNPLIPFSGTLFGTGFPRKLSFDQTVFQVGASDTVTGPQIVSAGASTLRSVISGSANPVKVSATTMAGATDELVARLRKQGYVRDAVAPEITTDLPATWQLQDGATKAFSVTLSPDSFPDPEDTFAAPTYQWFKGGTLIPGATAATFTVTGGVSTATNGIGSYNVVVTNDAGSVTSGTVVVTPIATTFATNLPTTDTTLVGANSKFLSTVISPTPITPPTFQWLKATSAAGPFTPITAANGGTNASLLVIGGEAATGTGFYRQDVTTSAGTIQSAVCNLTVGVVGTNFAFTANLPRTQSLASGATFTLSPVVNSAAGTPAVSFRQWFKAPLNNPTSFTLISPGGDGSTFVVTGNAAASNGPGVYRMVATSVGATPTVITTIDCTVTTAP